MQRKQIWFIEPKGEQGGYRKGLRSKGVKLVQTAKAHKTKKEGAEAHFFVLCDWLRVNELCTWPQIRFRFFLAVVEREEKEGRERGESGRGGEKLLSRAAFQFMLIRWPVQYASYMQMSRLHVPPIFRQLPAPLPPLSFSSPLAT